MKIITPHYLLLDERVASDLSVAFDKQIIKIGTLEDLTRQYPEAQKIKLQKYSLLMPGLINAHVHLEFSANKTELSYGDFVNWLYSVIENREELITSCSTECMLQACDAMLYAGITSFGAISSHAMDLEACESAAQNVVYFNELIGSQAVMADTLYGDFLARLDASKKIEREGFYPGVAIHSPYSVHPILIKKALEIVKSEDLRLTAHFMESQAERDWLDKSEGDFKKFFKELLKQESALCGAEEFLRYFDGIETLLTHSVDANERELETLAENGHTIIHCPISNRLLGNKTLDLEALNVKNIRWVVATDGLSSNYKLDLFEEMKISLFMHPQMPLLPLAKSLLRSVTKDAADALGLNSGEIKEGKNADMIVLDLESEATEQLALHLILHRYNISKVYINGDLKKGE